MKPVELIRNFYLKPELAGNMAIENKYAGQIQGKMRLLNVPNIPDERTLLRINYVEKDLLKIAYQINDQEPVKSKLSTYRLFAGTGLSVNKAIYSGAHPLAKPDAKSKTSYMPLITGGLDFLANPSIGKMIYRLELSLFASKNEISTAVQSHSFNQLSVAAAPQVIRNFYNANRVKVFGGFGFGLNFSSYSNNESAVYNTFKKRMDITKDFVDLKVFNFSFQGSAGVVLNKRVEISLGYILPAAITDYAYYNIAMRRYKVGVNYLFGKH